MVRNVHRIIPHTSGVVWLAWEKQRRSTTLAHELGAALFQLESNRPRPIRYLELSLRTLRILFTHKPKFIFVQNPSVVLSLLAALFKKINYSSKVIIDSHTPYLQLSGVSKFLFDAITRFVFNSVDLVLITNEDLRQMYRRRYPKASFYVLPDKIPSFPGVLPTHLPGGINLLLICTYAQDEPYLEAFKAMGEIGNATLYVTGKKSKVPKDLLNAIPANVVLTDYIPESEFLSLLKSVDIIIDLTNTEHCMVCGAYEAVATEKPMILSDKKVLREYFDEGVIHTPNDSKAIAESIRQAISEIDDLREGVKKLKVKRRKEWIEKWHGLLETIQLSYEPA
jgi:hypothetical protein